MALKTKLYDTHVSLKGHLVPFGGYLLPTHYSSIKNEHELVRSKAGLFDVSHMGELIISGNDAFSFLQKVTVNDLELLKVGQAQYSAMCFEDGGIVDDLIVYRQEDYFMMVVNAANRKKNLNWLKKNCEYNVAIKDISDEMGLLAIQGPRSKDILQSLTDSNLSSIEFYNFINGKITGHNAVISRTGYTGELGYEIYVSSDNINHVWNRIMDAGSEHGLGPAGLGCRDTLRLEMKYPLYGNDINETTNPIEAGLGWITRLGKNDFIGKSALIEKKKKVNRRLVCIEMTERAIPRNGCRIYNDNELVGTITSGTMSPSLGRGIGLGYVNIPFTEAGVELQIDIRGNRKGCMIIKPPFYKKGSLLD